MVRKSDLAEEFETDAKTIQRDIQFFSQNHLISPNVQRGYHPEPRLFQIIDRLERLDPVKYDFEKPWRMAYPVAPKLDI